jgi:thiazole tautomerase (transcriptional regulator TenI)
MDTPSHAPRLMLVTDATRTRWPLLDLAGETVASGVDAIYLRDVDPSADDMASLVGALRDRIGGHAGDEDTGCRVPAACAVLVNGDPGRARDLGVGLHLRERDISPPEARKVLGPVAVLGRSVHGPDGASRAAGADYLLAGHVYPSRSKPGLPPLGLSGLAAIVAAAPCPVLAIGGITPERVAEVVRAGAYGVAVIGAIAEADDPHAAAAALRVALDEACLTQAKESAMNDPSSPISAPGTVEVVANGKAAIMPTGATIHDFLVSKGMTDAMAIVERNGFIVPRAAYGSTELQAGDRLEVVHAVGGG